MTPSAAPGGGDGGRGRRVLLLAGIGLPLVLALSAAGMWISHSRGRQQECRRRLQALAAAAERYADANGGAYPYGTRAVEELLLRHIRSRELVICPATRRVYRWTAHARRRSDPRHLLLAWENPRLGGHGLTGSRCHVLYVGGAVELLPAEKLANMLREEAREPPTPEKLPARPRPGLHDPTDSLPPESSLPPPGFKEGNNRPSPAAAP